MQYYDRRNVPLARELRKNMTPWERKLWYQFLRAYPVRFQRQKPIDRYIVDFYCASARLAVELDGGGHYEPETMIRDEARTACLNQHHIKVLRFCNADVMSNFSGVCDVIHAEVQQTLGKTYAMVK